MFSSFWKLLGYPIFRYRRISESSISTLVLQKQLQPTSVLEVKATVANVLGIQTDIIDVINNTVILENHHRVSTNGDVTEVLVHRQSRCVPDGKGTEEEDMFDGSMTDEDRVEMSCGHAATPENLYMYCLTKLKSCDLGFKCVECGIIWEFTEITRKADMSVDESVFFSRKMTEVFLDQSDDIRQCPTCSSYCSRIDTSTQHVTCLMCQKSGRSRALYTFCWNCNRLWTKNHSCSRRLTQEILDNCERITMKYSNIPDVPKVRACPNCGMYIEHESGCKTMDCPECHHTFCFSCLKPKTPNGNLQCGIFNSKCKVAPVQKIGAKKA